MRGNISTFGAVSLLALMVAMPAYAQSTTVETDAAGGAPARATPAQASTTDEKAAPVGDEVIVTGYRNSLRKALIQKRDADRVQEVLVAEDLGKLPEASIAESLARLPGVATNRDRGNGTQISIRGLGPNLVNTLLNGREIVSAEANRNIRYDDYPAELLNGAYVYKSPTAAQVEGAIAGQVDLQTVRPLDQKGRHIAINVRGSYNDLASDISDAKPFGYIGSISYVDQFFDETLGIAVGYSGRRQANATARTNIFRYTNAFQDFNGDGNGYLGVPPSAANGFAGDAIPYGYEALVRGGDDIRHGALAAVQWKPGNGPFELNGDFFYSHVKFNETQRGFRANGLPFGNDFTNVTESSNYVTSATSTANANFGLDVQNVNEQFFFVDDLYAGGLNAKYQQGGWTLIGDAGYSTTHREQQFLTLRTEYSATANGFTFRDFFGSQGTFTGNPGGPASFSFNHDLTNPNINRISEFQIPDPTAAPLINDDLLTLRGEVRRNIGASFLKEIVAGVRYTDRTKDFTQRSQFGFIDEGARVPIPASLILGVVNFPGSFGNTVPNTLAIDIDAAVNQFFGPINPQTSDFDRSASWVVRERTGAAYVQANLDGDLGNVPISGNIGVRVVRTETKSSSSTVDGQAGSLIVTPFSISNGYTDWLPELNLTAKLSDKIQVRFGASKAIARPPLDDLNAGAAVFQDNTGAPSANGGNPLLEPFRAKQLDLTFEWYFDKDSALTISGFYKKLDTFIVTQTTFPTLPDANGNPVTGSFSRPVNGTGGNIKGFEVLFQKAFTFLPAPFDGLGIYLNYSYTDSSVQIMERDNAIGATDLPGFSKHVGNATLYYSKAGYEARVAYRYRSSYATELGDTDRILYTTDEKVLDFQTSYTFQDSSPLKGLQVLFQVSNLTNEPFETYYGNPALQGRYESFGRRYQVGFGYKF